MAGRRAESPFDSYLKEIQRYALLDAKRERELGRAIQLAASPGIRRAKGPRALLRRMEVETAAEEARAELTCHNLRLVVSVAKRHLGRGLTLPDLVEEGNVGLFHAAQLFDPVHAVKFSTYATWWIEQAIRRSIVNTVKTVRIPRHMVQELTRWRAWARKFAQREGREPDATEVAAAMDLPAAKKKLLRRLFEASPAGSATVSLDVLFEDQQTVADPHAQRPDQVEFTEAEQERLTTLLDRLPEREAQIVRLRYGLGEHERPRTLREIGRDLNLSRERVRQLERLAVEKLRGAIESGRD